LIKRINPLNLPKQINQLFASTTCIWSVFTVQLNMNSLFATLFGTKANTKLNIWYSSSISTGNIFSLPIINLYYWYFYPKFNARSRWIYIQVDNICYRLAISVALKILDVGIYKLTLTLALSMTLKSWSTVRKYRLSLA